MSVVNFCKNGKSLGVPPESLFKYKTFSKYSMTYFDGYITLTRPDKLNDPWDSQLTPQWDMIRSIDELRAFWRLTPGNPAHERILQEQMCMLATSPEMLDFKILDDLNDLIRVCSFGQSWANTLLWAHYSTMFEGFCVQFNTKRLNAYLTCLNSASNIKFAEVCYSENAPIIDPVQYDIFASIEVMLSTKSIDWEYEKEWRIIISSEGQEDFQLLRLPKGVIEAVYFGHKAEDKLIFEASTRLKKFDPGISRYIIRPVRNAFRLDRTLLP